MLCSDEIFWGKIVSGNLPPWLLTTIVHRSTEQKHFTLIQVYLYKDKHASTSIVQRRTCHLSFVVLLPHTLPESNIFAPENQWLE